MLFVLSPAKSLDYETPVKVKEATLPRFVAQASELATLMRRKTSSQIAELMDISPALADLNRERFRQWSPEFTEGNSRQAALAFDGDVYGGLDARSLTLAQLRWAQAHVAILSGLYGVLRPLDRLQPYRLEMGIRLKNPKGADLYTYWGDTIAHTLDEMAAAEGKQPVIVNLASQEYFKAADRPALGSRVVECVFEDWKGGKYKIISFFAKRARGLMARYAIEHKAGSLARLKQFDREGYAFAPEASTDERLVFRRRQAE